MAPRPQRAYSRPLSKHPIPCNGREPHSFQKWQRPKLPPELHIGPLGFCRSLRFLIPFRKSQQNRRKQQDPAKANRHRKHVLVPPRQSLRSAKPKILVHEIAADKRNKRKDHRARARTLHVLESTSNTKFGSIPRINPLSPKSF